MKFQSRSSGRSRRSTRLGLAVVAASLVSAGAAHARTEVLRWTHARPSDVQRWEAHVGPSQGNYDQVFTLSNPSVDASGIHQSSIVVPDDATVYIALRAVGAGNVTSPYSNERLRAPAGGGGGGGGGGGSEDPVLGAGQTIPPASNSVARHDFSTLSVGTAVSGWVDTGSSFSLSPDDALFGIADIGGNRMLSTSSTANDIHSHLQTPPSSFAGSTFSGRLALTSAAGSAGVTSYSRFPSQARYYRLGSSAGGAFTIAGVPGLTCANASTGVVPTINTWYAFKLIVTSEASQNRIQAKVWRQGDPEPAGPQAECLDASSSRAVDGTIGVWSAGAGQKYWDDLEVTRLSSGGTPIAPPILIQIIPVTP
ncbi:MAG: hypothetical protein R3F21_15880 [Myxococcota bacterium]